MRPRLALAAASAMAVVAALGACSENKGGGDVDNSDLNKETTGSVATDPKQSLGPVVIEGAKKGGTLRIIRENDYEHLDPQRNYTLQATALGQLIYRTLTVFKQDGQGKLLLVGDLAETAGDDVNKDCKTWKYTLKKGLKYEDGTEIKASDVAYGIARSFEESLADGAVYIQTWLAGTGDYASVYKGPYTSGTDKVPGLDVDDNARTLVFNFKTPKCDMPFAASMNTTSPVPKAKDTKDKYDDRPFSSGPYKIKEYKPDTSLTLERNPNWDTNTDPLRTAYPDQVFVELGPTNTQATERVRADKGEDANAVAEDNAPAELASTLLDDASLKSRLINSPTGLVWRVAINNERIKDLKVRQAIAYAIDKQAVLTIFGGDAAGKITHTVLPPSTLGYKEYANPYDGGPNGNPDKAKELLAGQKVKLVFLVRNVDNPYLRAANAIKQSLERAGFEVVITPIERSNHNPATKTRGNQYDLYMSGWQPDWPSAASTLPVLFDGRSLQPRGNDNNHYLNASDVNSEIERISGLPAGQAGPEWLKLDEKITKDHCPAVPLFVARTFGLMGSKVGGVFNSDAIGQQVYYNAHIK